MTVQTCNHGYWLADCATCEKELGQCDFGSCQEPSEWYTLDKRDRRGFCPAHIGGKPIVLDPEREAFDEKRDEYERTTGQWS